LLKIWPDLSFCQLGIVLAIKYSSKVTKLKVDTAWQGA
jgi:hypothetical protein